MEHKIQLLDTVALLRAMPELGLKAGQVGTVVEVFGEDDFEVEFVDKKGHTIALLPLKCKDVLVASVRAGVGAVGRKSRMLIAHGLLRD